MRSGSTCSHHGRSAMSKRKFQIDQLIINSPYEEPSTYWSYDREVRMFERKEGRRPAGYVVATPGAKVFDDPGIFVAPGDHVAPDVGIHLVTRFKREMELPVAEVHVPAPQRGGQVVSVNVKVPLTIVRPDEQVAVESNQY